MIHTKRFLLAISMLVVADVAIAAIFPLYKKRIRRDVLLTASDNAETTVDNQVQVPAVDPVQPSVDNPVVVPAVDPVPAPVVTPEETTVDNQVQVPAADPVQPSVDNPVVAPAVDPVPAPVVTPEETTVDNQVQTPEVVAQQLADVLVSLSSISDSFASDIALYESLYSELDGLVEYFNNSDAGREKFFASILEWFNSAQQGTAQLQSLYDELKKASDSKDATIASLENQIDSLTAEATQERQSLTDVIAQLQSDLNMLHASCDALSSNQQENITQLADKLSSLETQYKNMVASRDYFIQNLNDFKAMVGDHFDQEKSDAEAIQAQLQPAA